MSGEAEAGEILVTSTVKDLVAGSGIDFEPSRGEHALKGVPGRWRLYRVLGYPATLTEESGLTPGRPTR